MAILNLHVSKKYLLTIFTLIFFILSGIYFLPKLRSKIQSNLTANKKTSQITTQEPTFTIKVPEQQAIKYWEVNDYSVEPFYPTGMKLTDDNPTIARWGDYLLGMDIEYFLDEDRGSTFSEYPTESITVKSVVRQIKAYNIKSHETIYIPLETPIWGGIWYLTSQIVDNNYYFGVGGAWGATLGYKITLPPSRYSQVKKLKTPLGNCLIKSGNNYVSRFCYEGCTYQLFDPISDKSQELLLMNEASNGYKFNRVDVLVGLDNKGNMILNRRVVDENSTDLKETYPSSGIYARSLSNESQLTKLIDRSEMPSVEFLDMYMTDNNENIILVSPSELFLLTLKDKKYRSIVTGKFVNGSWRTTDSGKTTLCITDENTREDLYINLKDGAYTSKRSDSCRSFSDLKDHNFVLNSLNLPENFKVQESTIYFDVYRINKNVPKSQIPAGAEIIQEES